MEGYCREGQDSFRVVAPQKKKKKNNNKFEDIKELEPRETHKYLGIEESHDIWHKNENEKLKKEYLRRLTLVLRTELSVKNKIQATGSFAIPVLR